MGQHNLNKSSFGRDLQGHYHVHSVSESIQKLFEMVQKKNNNHDLFQQVKATLGSGSMNIKTWLLDSFVWKWSILTGAKASNGKLRHATIH